MTVRARASATSQLQTRQRGPLQPKKQLRLYAKRTGRPAPVQSQGQEIGCWFRRCFAGRKRGRVPTENVPPDFSPDSDEQYAPVRAKCHGHSRLTLADLPSEWR